MNARVSANRTHTFILAMLCLLPVSVIGATRATSVPADTPAQEDCSDWEDWDNLRFWGLWTDRYHISSSPDFNPHETSRWWEPVDILFADGERHDEVEPGYTLDDHHDLCEDGWL